MFNLSVALSLVVLVIAPLSVQASFHNECLGLHNAHRAGRAGHLGNAPGNIIDYATKRAEQICHRFTHENLPQGYGENIAMHSGYNHGCGTAMNLWLNSPGHYQNIMNGNYRQLACGRANCNGNSYFACLYGL